MADNIGLLGSNFNEGYKTGYATGGKKAGLGAALAEIVRKMQEQQKNQADSDSATQLLGAKGLMEGKLQPSSDKGSFAVNGLVDSQGNPITIKAADSSQTVYEKTTDDNGNDTYKPVVKLKKGDKIAAQGYGAAGIKFAEKEAQPILDAIKKGDYGPYMNSNANTKTAVGALASKQGIDLEKGIMGYKAQSSEMGNARIQGLKVNQANTLMATISGNYDPKTDTFNIPPSQHTEIAMGLARLLSPQGQVSENLTNQLQQGTLHQKLADIAIYFGADPSVTSGPTQSLIQFLQKQIDIQGQSAQSMLDTYNQGSSPTYKSIKQQKTGTSTSTGLTYTLS